MSNKPKNAPLPEGIEVGGYRVVKKLSSGGFSFVYLAYDEDNNPVAIKEYLPGSLCERNDGELTPIIRQENLATFRLGLRCFFEEGRVLARIFHPNIVRVVNFFRAHETVYMVMVYESGRSLQEIVLKYRDKGEKEILSEMFIRQTFTQVMNGLREVHANKLLHLDLKPANIFLRRDASPIILDFGAARTTLATDASKLFPMYTPGFAPPEMYVKGGSLGPWTDIYALGACLFACMAGLPPQAADVRKQNDRMEAAFKSLRGIYSDELIDLARWCLDMDLSKRPQSVFALQKAMVDRITEDSRPPWMARMVSSMKHALGNKRSAEAIVKSTKKGPGTASLWGGKKKQQESDKAIN
jgi:eukaryotic-like serine/threonine-protein kinase